MGSQFVKYAAPAQPSVIALQGSGVPPQWIALTGCIEPSHRVYTPEQLQAAEPRQTRAYLRAPVDFSIRDEAERSLAIIDRSDKPIHLVDHSYGGAVALYLASVRSNKIASVTLFEPCMFNLLIDFEWRFPAELAELRSITASVQSKIALHDHRGAMNEFVDYWSGPGTWKFMPAGQQDHIAGWAPKAAMAFNALLQHESEPIDYQNLRMPVRLLTGMASPKPMLSIAQLLFESIPDCALSCLQGMGHMGPVTHAPQLAQLIASYIEGYSIPAPNIDNRGGEQCNLYAA